MEQKYVCAWRRIDYNDAAVFLNTVVVIYVEQSINVDV